MPTPTPTPTSTPTPTPTPAGTRRIDHTNWDPRSLSDAAILAARGLDVYFQHASVGGNICAGIDALNYQSGSRYRTEMAYYDGVDVDPAWYANHDGIGRYYRGNPGTAQKVALFASSMGKPSLTAAIDVAMWKFCYVDAPVDAAAAASLFAQVRDMMAAAQAANPGLALVWWTMPLHEDGRRGTQAYNELVRSHCAANGLWLMDIAAILSHDDAGAAWVDGEGNERLVAAYDIAPGNAEDEHLSAAGQLKMAYAYWSLLAALAGEAAVPR